MKDSFNLNKWLTENRVTRGSRILSEQVTEQGENNDIWDLVDHDKLPDELQQIGYVPSPDGSTLEVHVPAEDADYVTNKLKATGLKLKVEYSEDVHGDTIAIFTITEGLENYMKESGM